MWFSKAAISLNKVLTPVTRYFNMVGMGFLALMMFLTTADVIGRYLFNSPVAGTMEMTEFLMALLVAFGLAYCQVKKGHISVDLVISKLPKRTQAIINSITCLLFLCISGLIAWRLILYAERLRIGLYDSASLHIPMYPFVYLVAVGCIMLCLILIADLLANLAEIADNRKWWNWGGLLLLMVAVVFLFSLPLWGQAFLFKIDPVTAGYAFIGLLIVMMFSGMPVGIVMSVTGLMGIAFIDGITPAFTSLATTTYGSVASYSLTVAPLFILMGAFTFFSGMAKELFDVANACFGRLSGGLAVATIGASAAFAAVSGSSVAATATIGMIALPEMRRYKYDDALSCGAIAAGGGLSIMIPPSITFVIYGILTGQSIGKLLIAGIIPGILLAFLYMVAIWIMCLNNPNLGPKGDKMTLLQRLVSLKNTWSVLLLFIVVMGGIYMGIFTPTEAAGIGAFGAFAIGIARKRLKWKGFVGSLMDSIQTTAMAFLILIGANIFGNMITVAGVPGALSATILNLTVDRYIIMIVIVFIYLFLGSIMASLAMVVLTVPIFFPIIVALGFDPIWFGVIIVLVCEMGQLTPPVGINVFVIHGIAKTVPMYTIFKGIIPFLLCEFVLAALLMVFPQIATLLPSFMK